jgi:hypothetical protein
VAFAFDTLGYSKRLREAGVPNNQAETHAEAARDFTMTEPVTKSDLFVVKSELESRLLATRNDLQNAIETQTLRLTVRLGSIIVACIGVLAFILRPH